MYKKIFFNLEPNEKSSSNGGGNYFVMNLKFPYDKIKETAMCFYSPFFLISSIAALLPACSALSNAQLYNSLAFCSSPPDL